MILLVTVPVHVDGSGLSLSHKMTASASEISASFRELSDYKLVHLLRLCYPTLYFISEGIV